MANSNKYRSTGLFSQLIGVAKKLSVKSLDLANHVAPGSISKLDHPTTEQTIVETIPESETSEKNMSDKKSYENPQQLFRTHVPKVTQQLLGRHFSKVNNVASFISPDLNHKISDFFFDKLNDFVSEQSSVDHLLKEVGAKNLSELAENPDRSNRISAALANQNKTVAAIAGAVSGASGVVGAAVDIPLSLALTLKMIYQSGRAHGFELDHKSEQKVVEYVFKEVDFASIAEKQTLLVALRAFSNLLQTHDTQQLQRMLGSSNDIEPLKKWLSHADGTVKWSWLNKLPQISILSKLTPLAGAGIGAVYSWKLIDDANLKAQHIFSVAQQYLLEHPNEKLDLLSAYEHSIALNTQASAVLSLAQASEEQAKPSEEQVEPSQQQGAQQAEALIKPQTVSVDNQAIKKVEIKLKSDEPQPKPEPLESRLQKLVEEHVEPVEEQTSQVSLADKGRDELIQPLDENDQDYSNQSLVNDLSESLAKDDAKSNNESKVVAAAKKKRATKSSVKKA